MRSGIMAGGLMAAAALFAGIGANAQVTPKGGGYIFRQKFTPGEKINYAVNVSASVPGMPGAPTGGAYKMQMNVRMNVLSVQNGIANVKVISDGMTLNGKTAQKGQSALLKIDSRGQTTGGGGRGGGVSPIFPQGPVKVGDTFASESGGVTSMGGVNTKTTFRFAGLKTYQGVKVAQLTLLSNMTGGTGGIKGGTNGFMLISMADGQVVSGRTDSSMNLGQTGKGMNVTSHMKIDRK